MKPDNLTTRIFLDSGDPKETRAVQVLLGFLDGQTTNPTLVSKNPAAAERLERGEKFSKQELLGFYREIVQEVASLIPQGSVSVEVYADKNTSVDEMLAEGRGMFSWIPNAHVKFPTTREGLEAASAAVKEGMRVNMTLCFSQQQAAAVYAATRGAEQGQVFVSPFIGRLDDRGENGMDLIKNILRMYREGAARRSGRASPNEVGRDGHVEVLTASVRNLNHFCEALDSGTHIITSPFKILKEWGEQGMPVPQDFAYESANLKPIPYEELDLERDWRSFDLSHELTDQGIERFSADWKKLIV